MLSDLYGFPAIIVLYCSFLSGVLDLFSTTQFMLVEFFLADMRVHVGPEDQIESLVLSEWFSQIFASG